MNGSETDHIDRAIMYELQRDARRTATEIAETVDVSDTTVRNRIEELEAEGVIEGYTALINYERAGFQRPFHFSCTVPIIEREEVAERAIDVPGVVIVTERMTGRGNLLVVAVGEHPDDVTRVARRLTELGAEIDDETVVRSSQYAPLAYLAEGVHQDEHE